jgi:hypothetical protein
MKHVATAFVVLSLGFSATLLEAGDPPDAKVNPVSNHIEIVDPVWAETNYDIRYVVNPGRTATTVELATDPADDLRPRLALSQSGDAWVVWWRNGSTPQVLVRTHDHTSDTWSAEVALADPSTPGRNPEVVHDGAAAWVTFECQEGPQTGIRVRAIDDTPDPFGDFVEIASTSYDGNLDLRIHASAGGLWVTWIDSLAEVGWCEYDYASGSWGLPDYISYTDGDAEAAADQIELTVLGN